jgi:hypothetical protein
MAPALIVWNWAPRCTTPDGPDTHMLVANPPVADRETHGPVMIVMTNV